MQSKSVQLIKLFLLIVFLCETTYCLNDLINTKPDDNRNTNQGFLNSHESLSSTSNEDPSKEISESSNGGKKSSYKVLYLPVIPVKATKNGNPSQSLPSQQKSKFNHEMGSFAMASSFNPSGPNSESSTYSS